MWPPDGATSKAPRRAAKASHLIASLISSDLVPEREYRIKIVPPMWLWTRSSSELDKRVLAETDEVWAGPGVSEPGPLPAEQLSRLTTPSVWTNGSDPETASDEFEWPSLQYRIAWHVRQARRSAWTASGCTPPWPCSRWWRLCRHAVVTNFQPYEACVRVRSVVGDPGLEPGWVTPHAPQTCASTSSASRPALAG